MDYPDTEEDKRRPNWDSQSTFDSSSLNQPDLLFEQHMSFNS